jgi:hypothetical protein
MHHVLRVVKAEVDLLWLPVSNRICTADRVSIVLYESATPLDLILL